MSGGTAKTERRRTKVSDIQYFMKRGGPLGYHKYCIWGRRIEGRLQSEWPVCEVYGNRTKSIAIMRMLNRYGQKLRVGCAK